MELAGEPRIGLMADALIGAVVHVDEKLFPVSAQGLGIYRVSVVLRGDITFLRTHKAYGLVMAAMAIFQLVDCCASSLTQQLVTHTDATDGLTTKAHLFANDVHSLLASVGVTGTISQEQAIEVHTCIILIPRYANHLYPTVDQAANNIGLYTTIDEHYFLTRSLIVAYNLLT